MKLPVLILTYNRPNKLIKVLDIVKRNTDKKFIYVSVDGPKNKNDKRKIKKIKYILKKNSITNIKYNDVNYGCKKAVFSALDWFFDFVNCGIILEDDCVPNDKFFLYCNTLLKKYENNKCIFSINGTSPIQFKENEFTYYYSSYPLVWGWATWRDRWFGIDKNIREWNKFIKTDEWKNKFDNMERKYWENKMYQVLNGDLDTWDYQIFANMFMNDQKSIMPLHNMIKNIGFDKYATHTKDSNNEKSKLIYGNYEKYVNNNNMYKNSILDKEIYNLFFNKINKTVKKLTLKNKIIYYIKKERIKIKNQTLIINNSVKYYNTKYIVNKYKNNYDVCHIICSGSSVNNTVSKIKDNDIVIGFNYALLLPIYYDIYFFEFGSDKDGGITKHQRLLYDSEKYRLGDVFFKNIWDNKNDINTIKNVWLNEIPLLREFHIPTNNIYQVVKEINNTKSKWIPQYGSTLLTAINLAIRFRVKQIYIHGLDFGGPYFFDDINFKGNKNIIPHDEIRSKYYKKLKKNDIHEVSKNPLESIINKIKYNKNIEIIK